MGEQILTIVASRDKNVITETFFQQQNLHSLEKVTLGVQTLL